MNQDTIAAGEFKAKCLHLIDDVAKTRSELIITKRGKPVAKLVPIPDTAPLFGCMKGSVLEASDIISPIDESWDAAH